MDSRQKMMEATLRLLRTQGLRATGMNQIVEESGAPRGSIYYHFPEGKTQLVIETLKIAGAAVENKIADALDSHSYIPLALRKYVESYGKEIRESDFQRGCPVGNVAMDVAATDPAIRKVCNNIFGSWTTLIANRMKLQGVSKEEADSLAEFVVSSLEGALILCKAQRSLTPLHRIGDRMEKMLASAFHKKKISRKGAKISRK